MRAVNPVLARELLERFRARRATVTLTAYLGVLGLLLYGLYSIGVAALDHGFGLPVEAAGPMLGRFLVEGLLFFVLLGVLFVAPGYAAGQISGERERRTLPLLQMTLLRPHQIVLGKLGAATAWLVLLVLAAVPLGAAAFFLGGVAVTDLARGVAFVVVVAVAVAGMAIGISSVTKRTVGAVVLTYGVVLALTVGTLFGALAEFVGRQARGQPDPPTPMALYLNPVFGLSDAVRAIRASETFMTGEVLPSPLAIMAEALPRDRQAQRRFPAPDDFGFVDDGFPDRTSQRTWLVVAGLYLTLGLGGLAVATLRLRTTDVSARVRARRGRTAPSTPVSRPDGALPGVAGVAAGDGGGTWGRSP